MRAFVFYLRCLDSADLETQRQACHRLAGDDANVLAEFIDRGGDNYEKLLRALDLSSQKARRLLGRRYRQAPFAELRQCPLWVISGHSAIPSPMSAIGG